MKLDYYPVLKAPLHTCIIFSNVCLTWFLQKERYKGFTFQHHTFVC